MIDGGVVIKFTQDGAVNEAWWSIEISETHEISSRVEFTCSLPLEVTIFEANQKRDDAILRNRLWDLLKWDWLNLIRSRDGLRRAEYSQTVPRLRSDQLESENFETLSEVYSCL